MAGRHPQRLCTLFMSSILQEKRAFQRCFRLLEGGCDVLSIWTWNMKGLIGTVVPQRRACVHCGKCPAVGVSGLQPAPCHVASALGTGGFRQVAVRWEWCLGGSGMSLLPVSRQRACALQAGTWAAGTRSRVVPQLCHCAYGYINSLYLLIMFPLPV